MKYSQKFTLLLSLIFPFLFLTSCSGSDSDPVKDKNNSKIYKTLKANAWKSKDIDIKINSPEDVYADIDVDILYFETDSTGYVYTIQKDYDSILGNKVSTDYDDFKYDVYGNTIYIKSKYTSYSLQFSETALYTDGGVFYFASKMKSSDFDLIKSFKPIIGKCGNNLIYTYNKKDNSLVIDGSGDMYDYTTTSQPWNNYTIYSVEISNGVTSIGNNAFNGTLLQSVDFKKPCSIKSLGAKSFANTLINSVTIPASVQELKESAFADNKYLSSVWFDYDSELNRIGSYVFYNCPKISKLSLPKFEKLVFLDDFAFSSTPITEFYFNDGLLQIGSCALLGGIENSSIELPSSLKTIGETAILGKFNKIHISENITTIKEKAFISSKTGTLTIDSRIAPTTGSCIVAGDSEWENNDSKWSLSVPTGCESNYNKTPWNNFKRDDMVSGNNNQDNTQYEGIIQGHKYIDLGLSVKWATCNVGAESSDEIGDYFCWGHWETDQDTPRFHYNGDGNLSGTDFDPVKKIWGNKWRSPTVEQCNELIDKCTFSKVTIRNKTYLQAKSKINGQILLLNLGGWYYGFYECSDTSFELRNFGSDGVLFIGDYRSVDIYGGWGSVMEYFNTGKPKCKELYLRTTIFSSTYKFNLRGVTD